MTALKLTLDRCNGLSCSSTAPRPWSTWVVPARQVAGRIRRPRFPDAVAWDGEPAPCGSAPAGRHCPNRASIHRAHSKTASGKVQKLLLSPRFAEIPARPEPRPPGSETASREIRHARLRVADEVQET